MATVNRDALIDKLCERLAAETGGIDLYQAALDKLDDATIVPRLKRFLRDEMDHRELLATYLDRMHVTDRETRSARLAQLEADAFVKLVGEAQTAAEVLNVILTFELMDENAWEMIIDVGRDFHDDDMVRTFTGALRDEKEHLRGVRGMLAQLTRSTMASVSQNT